MSRERAKILQMLADGAITADQAEQLLDAIGDEPREDADPAWEAQDAGSSYSYMYSTGRGRPIAFAVPPVPPVPPINLRRRRRGGRHGGRFDQLIQLALRDIKPGIAQELRDALREDLSMEDVLRLATLGVEPDYIRRLKEAVPDLTVDQVVKAAAFHVAPERLREWLDLDLEGFTSPDGPDS